MRTSQHEHVHGRGLKEIREIIESAAISDHAKTTAIAIFEALGAAEAKIHNTDIEKSSLPRSGRRGCDGRYCLCRRGS